MGAGGSACIIAALCVAAAAGAAAVPGASVHASGNADWLMAFAGIEMRHLDAVGTLSTAAGIERVEVDEMLHRFTERSADVDLHRLGVRHAPSSLVPGLHLADVWLVEESRSTNARCPDPAVQVETVHPGMAVHANLWIYEGHYHSPAASNVSVEGHGFAFSWTFHTAESTTGKWSSWVGWSDFFCYQVALDGGMLTVNAPYINGALRVTDEPPGNQRS